MLVPDRQRWIFWDVEAERLDVEIDADAILPRVIERGDAEAVRWIVTAYGLERIHSFLRDVGHPELSARTLAFWRAALNASTETWAEAPEWRRSSKLPWPD